MFRSGFKIAFKAPFDRLMALREIEGAISVLRQIVQSSKYYIYSSV
jgi:hypothetical protein